MKKKLILYVGLLCFVPKVHAQGYLTLKEAIATGLESNYGIQIAENERRIAEINHSPGEAGLLPTVDAVASKNYSVESGERRIFGAGRDTLFVLEGVKSNSFNGAIDANYLINVGSVFTFQRLGTLGEISRLEAKVTIENTIAGITTIYYRVVLEQQRYEVLQNTLELSEERRRISKDKYELGKASRQEYLAAQVDYNTDLTALINQEEIIATARIQLNELMGQAPRQEMVIKDTIVINKEIDLEELLGSANLNNPQLLAAQRQINVTHLQMRELQAQRLPELNLFGTYTIRNSEAPANQLLYSSINGLNYGLSARINLFNGFVLNNQIQNARIAKQNEELQYKNLQLELESDISEAYNAYRNNLRLLEVAQANYEVAMENAEIALLRYRLGNTSALEFREAQQNALAAESRLINALYSIKATEVELLRLAGSVMSAI